MICTCSPEEITKAEAMRAEFWERSGAAPENWVSFIVYSLEWDYQAAIMQMACDQWACVNSEKWDKSFSYSIMCDQLEDGLMATWIAYADEEERRDNAPSQG